MNQSLDGTPRSPLCQYELENHNNQNNNDFFPKFFQESTKSIAVIICKAIKKGPMRNSIKKCCI